MSDQTTTIVAESGTWVTTETPISDIRADHRVLLSDGGVYTVNRFHNVGEDETFMTVTRETDGTEHEVPVDGTTVLAVIVDSANDTDQENTAGSGNGELVKPDLTQCTVQSPSGRRCKLAPGHVNSADAKERKHRFVIREEVAQPKTLAELKATDKKLSSFVLTAEAIPAGEDVSRQYNREVERDADQKRVDADAKKAYDKWVKGGSKKGAFEDLAPKYGMRFIVPPVAFDTVIMMLRKSTQSGAATYGKKLAYRRGQHTSGNTIINWMIVDQGTFPKASKDGNGASDEN